MTKKRIINNDEETKERLQLQSSVNLFRFIVQCKFVNSDRETIL